MRGGTGVTPARLAALDVLRRVRTGEFADHALDRASIDLPTRDRAWLQELAYGTLRLRGRSDYILDALVRGGIESLEADVLDVLRLGVYQLLEMRSVPGYAAISQSQELARAAGVGRVAGLVGGVLHALERGRDEIRFPDFVADPIGHLSTWGSHPRWLVERWVERWGADDTRVLVEANNRRPDLFIRPIGVDVAEAIERLAARGISGEPVSFAPDCIRLAPTVNAGDAIAVVPAVVQDPAAALVSRYAAPPPESVALDLCAAPGGKALGLAEAAGYVVAADVSPKRLLLLRDNASRVMTRGGPGLVVADARQPPFREGDVVLLDVPCSGTGTLRRHPDGRWRIRETDLEELTRLQRDLMDAASVLVRPGGLLVYSTCSLEAEENEVQVNEFLARHSDFVPDPPRVGLEPELIDAGGGLRVLPQRYGADGSFAARLRRVD